MSEWLEGKKTIIAGALVAVMSLLSGLGVIEIPPDLAAGIDAFLGALIIFFRIRAKKVILESNKAEAELLNQPKPR
jgi:hypothetical protein